MSKSILNCEGSFFDDNDHLITSYSVDFRDPKKQIPIKTVIKGSREKYALESGKTIRIAKPEEFRKFGEGLIWDPEEMRFSRASEESRHKNRAGDTGRSRKTTHSLTFGKNGWIYCTSIEPTSQEEKNRWRNSMLTCGYDHFSYIHRPRTFARALASMVAEQLGPRDKVKELDSRFGDFRRAQTGLSGQTVFHGPVIYADDPYEAITNVSSDFERLLLPFFLKRVKFQDQREYRFAVWAEEEPPEKFPILNISFAMLGSLKKR